MGLKKYCLGVALESAVFEKDRLFLGGVRRPSNHV